MGDMMKDIPQLSTLIQQQQEMHGPGDRGNRHAPLASRMILEANLADYKSNGLKPLKLSGKFASMSARAKSNPRPAPGHKKNAFSMSGTEAKNPFAATADSHNKSQAISVPRAQRSHASGYRSPAERSQQEIQESNDALMVAEEAIAKYHRDMFNLESKMREQLEKRKRERAGIIPQAVVEAQMDAYAVPDELDG